MKTIIYALLLSLLVVSVAAQPVLTDRERLTESALDEADVRAAAPSENDAKESIHSPNKFLLWTHDLEHVLWGIYGSGFFVGEDNHGKTAYGIYNAGVFAGFYDGNFFHGKYRSHKWTAIGLFEDGRTRGSFTTAQ